MAASATEEKISQQCKADAVDFFVLSAVKTTFGGGGDESVQGVYLLVMICL